MGPILWGNMPQISRFRVLSLTLVLVFVGTSWAQAVPTFTKETISKKDVIRLPVEIKADERDLWFETFNEKVMVLALTTDNALLRENHRVYPGYKANKTVIPVVQRGLTKLLSSFFADKTPDNRVVYLKADVKAGYGNVLQFFDLVRKAEVDRVVLVVIDQDIPNKRNAGGFEVRLTGKYFYDKFLAKPSGLTLVAGLTAEGGIVLNGVDHGRLSDPQRLIASLRETFQAREEKRIFREGTNEIEKTVFLKASKSTSYADFVKLLSTVKNAGASRVGVQIDGVD